MAKCDRCLTKYGFGYGLYSAIRGIEYLVLASYFELLFPFDWLGLLMVTTVRYVDLEDEQNNEHFGSLLRLNTSTISCI